MDKKMQNRERETLAQALKALQELGLIIEARHDVRIDQHRNADAEVRVEYAGKQVTYLAEVKRNLRPVTLGAMLEQLQALGAKRPLLVADHVTPPIAQRLREQGVEFIDAAGNAWLNEPPLLVWVTGRPRGEKQAPYATNRAFQAGGLRVLFTLLCKPEIANLPYREIARQAGVAHGTVGWAMTELPRLGLMAEYRKRRVLVQYDRLLTQWAEGYARTLRPKRMLMQYQAGGIDWWKDLDAVDFQYVLGGEPAGARLTGHLRPERITLYADEINQKFAARYRLRKADEGNVEILKRFWKFPEERPGLAPAPLVYADLLATGETRCIETAKKIYEDIVRGFEQQN
jgi:hypothetical protein